MTNWKQLTELHWIVSAVENTTPVILSGEFGELGQVATIHNTDRPDDEDGEPSTESLTNARLMAAAPDLLRACLQSIELSQHADGCKWFDVPMKDLSTAEGRARADLKCDCHIRDCRLAIEKVVTAS